MRELKMSREPNKKSRKCAIYVPRKIYDFTACAYETDVRVIIAIAGFFQRLKQSFLLSWN